MKRYLALALTLCLMFTMLVGCGGGAKEEPAAPETTPAEVESDSGADEAETDEAEATAGGDSAAIAFSWWGGDSRHDATQKAVDAFEEKYSNITVEETYGAWTGWEENMSTSFYAGTAPDVNQINWNWLYMFDNGGTTFVDLNTVSDILDLSQFDEKALEQCTINGSLSAIPVSMTGRLFFWNEAVFEEAGISVPKTYDELMAAGTTFQETLGDDYYPLVMGEYDRMIFMVWALECKYGKNWVENNEIQYSKEEIAEGLQMLLDMEEAHVMPTIQSLLGDGAESIDKNPKWISGQYGGIFEWDSSAGKMRDSLEDSSKFVVGDYLTGFGDYQGGFTKVSLGFAISQTSKNIEDSARLINFLVNEEEGAKLLGSERGIPLSKAGLAVCEEAGELDPMVTEANKKVLDWCDYVLDPTFEDASLKTLQEGVYYDVMAGTSYDEYTVEEGADILMEGINKLLEEQK